MVSEKVAAKADQLAVELETDNALRDTDRFDVIDADNKRMKQDLKTAQAVRSQSLLLDSVLDLCIRQQRLMLTARRLPSKINSCIDERQNVAQSLRQLLFKFDELRQIVTHDKNSIQSKRKTNDDDENDDNDNENENFASTDELWKRMDVIQQQSEENRRPILAELHARASATSGVKNKGGGLGQSYEAQLERVMADKERVLKRCQTVRSEYTVIGEKMPRLALTQHEDVYDDGDFYAALLRDVLSRANNGLTGATDVSDAVAHADAQRRALRAAKQATVDRKASKGRKLRYTVHEKLVSFMNPIERDDIDWDVELLFDNQVRLRMAASTAAT